MSDIAYVGQKIRSFRSSPQFDGFSKVVITVSDEIEYSAGTELGRALRLTCPWGTPQMAENILADIRGFQYQPYTADGAILDPSVELGDGITANNVYGGIYTQKIKFGPMLTATVSAPEDEELNHEYPYKSKPNKEIAREAKMLRASLAVEAARISAEVEDRKSAVETLRAQLQIQAGLIEAKVSKTGGSASSFGWVLDDSSWTIKANGSDVLKATKSGLEVSGKITATSGQIGGFTINSNSLSYNNQTWGGTNTNGIYLGPSGIQLGKNFKVDSAGNLTAASGTFSGYVKAGNIQYGGSSGTLSGSALTSHSVYGSQIGYSTISTAYTTGGINTSLGYADYSNDVFNGAEEVPNMYAANLFVTASLFVEKNLWMSYNNASRLVSVVPLTVQTPSGTVTKNFLTI